MSSDCKDLCVQEVPGGLASGRPPCLMDLDVGSLIESVSVLCSGSVLAIPLDGNARWSNNAAQATHNAGYVFLSDVLNALERTGQTVVFPDASQQTEVVKKIPATGFVNFDLDGTIGQPQNGRIDVAAWLVSYSTTALNGQGTGTFAPSSSPSGGASVEVDGLSSFVPQAQLPSWVCNPTKGNTVCRAVLLTSFVNAQSIWTRTNWVTTSGTERGNGGFTPNTLRMVGTGAENDTMSCFPFTFSVPFGQQVYAFLAALERINLTGRVRLNEARRALQHPKFREVYANLLLGLAQS